jgi:hypothetical protein
MEMLETFLRVLNSYPLWAKISAIGGVAFSILVLVFTPRSELTAGGGRGDGSIFLRITGVKLFPADPNVEVQLLAIVNGTEYVHPSIGGVEWMKVGPAMSQKLIELPKATNYEIRFEMRIRNQPDLNNSQGERHLASEPFDRAGSQLVNNIWALPFSDEYPLYELDGKTRNAQVRAVVKYIIYDSG